MNNNNQFHMDFLLIKPIQTLLRKPFFPLVFQIISLLFLMFFIWNGWGIGLAQSKQQTMTLRKTNLTTLFVWGLWWPGMIATALLAGRLWCTVCPMEFISRWGWAAGRLLGYNRVAITPWLRAGWLVVFAYLTLQFLVAGLSIHRVPHFTALMLIVLLALALLSGLLFREERAFCKTLCPAKALLSVYGRFTPIQIDVRDQAVCDACSTKDCRDPRKRERFDARACPSLARPDARKKGDECVLCLQCAKTCPHNNIGWGAAIHESASRRHLILRPYEAVFVMFAAGFVAHEVIGEMKPMDEYFHIAPQALNALIPSIGFGWFEALWFLFLVPALLWLAAAGLAYLLGHRGSWRDLLLAAATGAAPIIAVAHLAKALAKISSWGGFLPGALNDPAGIITLQRLENKILAAPIPLVDLSLLGWLMTAALLAIAWRNRLWLSQAVGDQLPAARAGFAVFTVFYSTILLSWPWF
ncbi:MAG: hypothetical protein AB1656_26170 [Candidatus Omnitrophota bacterium]